MNRETVPNTSLDIEYSDIIDRAVEDYGSHEGITRGRLVRWLRQFDAADRGVAAKVLKQIQFYGAPNIRSMARELVKMAHAEIPGCPRSRVYFVPIGGAGSGSQIVARHIKGMQDVRNSQVVDLVDLTRVDPGDVELLVFIDDFAGTGNTIAEWWQKIEPLVLPIGATNVLGVLVLNYRAATRLEAMFRTILAVATLDRSHNVFDTRCARFSRQEKRILLAACEATRCAPEFLRGYGECGLLVVFRHGCPNNSLPILWCDNRDWVGLFQRRNA